MTTANALFLPKLILILKLIKRQIVTANILFLLKLILILKWIKKKKKKKKG